MKTRNSYGFTLPFALILTFIFSALVGVSYMFVSINLRQMQNNLWSTQAASLAEGINERIKARLNTKSKIQLTPEQEDRLKDASLTEDEDPEEELDPEEQFNEQTEDFDEYYADEVLKISRYVSFREPPKDEKSSDGGRPKEAYAKPTEEDEKDAEKNKAEANVAMLGDIDIPEGTVLKKQMKLVLFKDEKFSLKLNDIVNTTQPYMSKLPVPKIKSLTPNYSEANKRSRLVVIGENLPKSDPSFNEKGIIIEEIKSGPQLELLITMNVQPGVKRFLWDTTQTEFYIIPTYDGSKNPNIRQVLNIDSTDFLEINAGKRGLPLKITGTGLFLNMETPVAIGDVGGLLPKVKNFSQSGNELAITLDVGRNVEPGVHSIIIATEGGLSNAWLFNVLPPLDKEEISLDSARVSSSLTLLDVMVLEKILPIINDNAAGQGNQQGNQQNNPGNNSSGSGRPQDPNSTDPAELSEEDKIGKFGNTDLETVWLLETSVMVGKNTKTVSEVVHRELPIINAALLANSKITFEGGSFPINGVTNATTMLVEPTYLSNSLLTVEGPPEEPENPIAAPTVSASSSNSGGGVSPGSRPAQAMTGPQSPIDLGFKEGSFVTVFKDGNKIEEIDYGLVSMVGRNTIELSPPGLMDYHYANDSILQFIPPIISREKLSDDDSNFHTTPKGLSLALPNSALFKNIFSSNLDQFAEVADLYTNDPTIPLDEYDLPVGYMGLTYIEGTPRYDTTNVLTGKGILIIDTRPGNLGKPVGDVEFNGDGRAPVDFKGIIYVHGNLRINGSLNLSGALIVDNEAGGEVNFASNSNGKITYDPQYIKQTILSIPFTTKSGTVMISSKPIDLSDYVQVGAKPTEETGLGAQPSESPQESSMTASGGAPLPAEEAIIENNQPSQNSGNSTEEELIDLF
jgi:hypothetical protein